MQYADVICDSEHYRKSHRLFNMQASVGAQRWLSLTEYRTAKCVYMVLLMLSGKGEGTDSNRYGVSCVVAHRECVESLRAQGYRIAASDLAPGTTPQVRRPDMRLLYK